MTHVFSVTSFYLLCCRSHEVLAYLAIPSGFGLALPQLWSSPLHLRRLSHCLPTCYWHEGLGPFCIFFRLKDLLNIFLYPHLKLPSWRFTHSFIIILCISTFMHLRPVSFMFVTSLSSSSFSRFDRRVRITRCVHQMVPENILNGKMKSIAKRAGNTHRDNVTRQSN